jgi:hypothetical protein
LLCGNLRLEIFREQLFITRPPLAVKCRVGKCRARGAVMRKFFIAKLFSGELRLLYATHKQDSYEFDPHELDRKTFGSNYEVGFSILRCGCRESHRSLYRMRQFQLQQYIVGSTGALAGILDGAIFTTKDTKGTRRNQKPS